MRRQLIWIAVGVLLLIQFAHASDQTIAVKDLSISILVGISDPVQEFARNFVKRVENNLRTEGILVTILETSSVFTHSRFNDVSLRIRVENIPSRPDNPLLIIEPLEPRFLDISPFPYAQYFYGDYGGGLDSFYLDSHVAEIALINLATGLALYSAGHCHVVPDYLEAARQEFEIMDSSTPIQRLERWLDFINFYEGNCALMESDFQRAATLFRPYAPSEYQFSASRVTLTNLIWASYMAGNHDEAFTEMETLLSLARQFGAEHETFALTRRAQLYALAFRYDDALTDMDAAIELDPTNPELYVLRGQIILYLYEWDRVLADYNHAIELAPDYADAYYYRGVLFYAQAQRDDALADFEHYLDLAPDGDHAADAEQYIIDIQRELEALN
jgi:tetratricopeptide (TPR) repeat protein